MAKASITIPKKEIKSVPPLVSIKKEYKGFVETPAQTQKFTELVIKEIMVQKQVSRDEAIKILEAHK
jgi:NACalpha-BTF3-like transcription factor